MHILQKIKGKLYFYIHKDIFLNNSCCVATNKTLMSLFKIVACTTISLMKKAFGSFSGKGKNVEKQNIILHTLDKTQNES